MDLSNRIERAYRASGNELGWRFLASPANVLDSAEVAFLGLNPGGRVRPTDHAEFAMPAGSAYVVESWAGHLPGGSPLQRQVRALFNGLAVEPEDVLAGNLVPFRSPDWASLHDREQALKFGIGLWREVLALARPELVIGMGRETTGALATMLDARNVQRVPIGWGKIAGVRADFANGTLVGLPHLSRFGIMLRPQSEAGLRTLFGRRWRSAGIACK
ncbi:MAG: hypothetical protein VYD87_01725 [Pseudomonadota bacterium]|nr:hypothetical protein [Pseudomonadota bacterium]